MDLDLAQVRAFVAVARLSHFGRAAEQLFVSQQALSKRIARLESVLGVRLFDRGSRGVALTEAGRRFLEPAQRALDAADLAVLEARREQPPLRIDVWGHLFGPVRMIGPVIERGVRAELGFSRDAAAAMTALTRGEIDAGFGRVPLPVDRQFQHRPVRLEPVDAVVNADHPLATADRARPVDLRGSTVWCPAPLRRLDFLDRLTDHFGLDAESAEVNLGLEHFLGHLTGDRVAVLPAGVQLPADTDLRRIRLVDPTPLYTWSLLWRRGRRLDALLRASAQAATRHGWLDYDPTRHWLPESLDATTHG
ncbi:LysR family transcriptional regulator [Saccharopolyspora subtropica]|uniref:LysR family transcriptional regulator n=1 Tax=Saccharopolyspora thermophila TaxID=89367 RepID=A0A917NHI4_9PSEU|nr:LysR family transcriptional regulator [Saccharopolyspora subtropica]GGJ01089.1 LysR family transcriptional regulator [Saccharopolyspora subtropica]